MESNLSQNDYPIQELNGSFLLPNILKQYVASCTTSVYVNLSKNSFLAPLVRKAGAKVHTFSELPKLFRENFHLSCKNSSTLDTSQDPKHATPY